MGHVYYQVNTSLLYFLNKTSELPKQDFFFTHTGLQHYLYRTGKLPTYYLNRTSILLKHSWLLFYPYRTSKLPTQDRYNILSLFLPWTWRRAVLWCCCGYWVYPLHLRQTWALEWGGSALGCSARALLQILVSHETVQNRKQNFKNVLSILGSKVSLRSKNLGQWSFWIEKKIHFEYRKSK